MYAEIIYETGDHSIGYYENEDELVNALETHHERAKNGEPRGPAGGPAERIARVLIYKEHPATFNDANLLSQSDVSALVKEIAVGDQVSAFELAARLRDAVEPMVNSEAHESNYKMQEERELDWSNN